MPVEVSFTLSEEDLEHFQTIVDKSKQAVQNEETLAHVEKAATRLIENARGGELPTFISERLLKLEVLLNMVRDEEWQLEDDERRSILSVLVYFADPKDMIPDDIPGIGLLDDAIYAEIVIRELGNEINAYQEFCQFRIAEEARRRRKGLDPHVDREDWLADKRAVLHSRMRNRRSGRESRRGWSLRVF